MKKPATVGNQSCHCAPCHAHEKKACYGCQTCWNSSTSRIPTPHSPVSHCAACPPTNHHECSLIVYYKWRVCSQDAQASASGASGSASVGMWLLNIIINVMTGIVQVKRRAGFQLLLGPGTSGVDVTCLFSVIDAGTRARRDRRWVRRSRAPPPVRASHPPLQPHAPIPYPFAAFHRPRASIHASLALSPFALVRAGALICRFTSRLKRELLPTWGAPRRCRFTVQPPPTPCKIQGKIQCKIPCKIPCKTFRAKDPVQDSWQSTSPPPACHCLDAVRRHRSPSPPSVAATAVSRRAAASHRRPVIPLPLPPCVLLLLYFLSYALEFVKGFTCNLLICQSLIKSLA